ncbi:MAG: type III-B CRISPR-associated protein Cas10/Cmr2 [Bacteroidales bacterium]|nr:type III-B CRISPR-associated protein Cas10/Cmr2 [Bacteroidales bacterium]
MSHLLAIAVGPVQEFIAAARRTRDLWFGSHLLSEISRAVAKSVETQGGKLIFPASTDAQNVANVILAELPKGSPKDVAKTAKEAAQACWREFAGKAYKATTRAIRQEIWDEQVGDVIEFYAAWVPHTDAKQYQNDRAKVMRLLTGRKNCRDFSPNPIKGVLPKSSLDGQRETVLQQEDERTKLPRSLRLSSGEQLDVVGVVKRLGGGTHPYPSTTRVAVDPWVRGHEKHLAAIREECRKLGHDVINPVTESKYQNFPFDGAILFPSRHPQLAEESGLNVQQFKAIQKLLEKLPEPNPYLAVLVADGDKMGAALSGLDSAEDHRKFSQALAGFANDARKIVQEHYGVLVYVGGDDVLAFLPVDQCLLCARALHDKFGELLQEYGNPTLSVGIAIGHSMENLEDLLNYGRAAEKAAKGDKVDKKFSRDGLAVHLRKRGNAPISVRSQWSQGPDERLQEFAKLMNQDIIPAKLPYELRTMAHVYKSESWSENAGTAIQQDLYRLIAKKTTKGAETVRNALSEYIRDMNAAKLKILAQELLIARLIAATLRQAEVRS